MDNSKVTKNVHCVYDVMYVYLSGVILGPLRASADAHSPSGAGTALQAGGYTGAQLPALTVNIDFNNTTFIEFSVL
jgi:hypothetical protein